MRALVVGGGIAGPVTAMALRKAGLEAVVYEAYTEGADDVGAFLTVMSNGLRALRAIAADRVVEAVSFPAHSVELFSGSGKRLGDMPIHGDPAARTLTRAGLYRALHDEAVARGVRIEHGRRLTGASPAGTGVVATFADGTEAEADVLIGADGLHSATRSLLDPAAPRPRYVGANTVCGFTDDPACAVPPSTYRMIYGRRAFFGCTTGEEGQTWWFANVPGPELSRDELATTPLGTWRERVAGLFAKDRTAAERTVRSSSRIVASNAYDLASVPVWHRGPMVVIGDAAHAAAPNAAQGASMAAEDGVVLAKCLRDLPDAPSAFAAYERLRRQRVERLVAASARMSGNVAQGPVRRAIRDLTMPRALRRRRGGTTESFGGYEIRWETPV